MSIKLTVPDIGDFESVEIVEVLIKQGDKINKGSLLFSVNSAWLKQQGVANICIMSVLNAQALKGLLPTQQKYVDGMQDSLFTLFL